MNQTYTTVEDLLMDESFIRCYYQTDPEQFQRWQKWIDESPAHRQLVQEAIQLLSLSLQKNETQQLPEHQNKNGFRRLTKKIKAKKNSNHIGKK